MGKNSTWEAEVEAGRALEFNFRTARLHRETVLKNHKEKKKILKKKILEQNFRH